MEKAAALQRITKYCAEAEHCTQDVVRKLHDWGMAEADITGLLEVLYREKFVDDARYAKSYVSEKWKLRQWGKIKIRHQLQEKGIDEAMIDESLSIIPQAGYAAAMEDILNQKWDELKQLLDAGTLRKVAAFGASRGIEEEMIEAWVEARGQ